MRGKSPLTEFLIALMAAPSEGLLKADPAKLAARWQINPAHCEGYLRLELENRGYGSSRQRAA